MSSRPPSLDPSVTKDRIIEVAQQLFAEEGFEKVSLRHITQAAEVNLAAVNYHFGGKEALIDAVVERYVNPINEQRLELLDREEASHGSDPVPVRNIIAAFVTPALSMVSRSEMSKLLFFKLLGRCMTNPAKRIPANVIDLFRQVSTRYPAAVQRSLPELDQSVILWRLHFTVGALAHTMGHGETLVALTEGRAGNPSPKAILTMLVDYCHAGMCSDNSNPAGAI